jgi:hypothetical protein
MGGGGSLEGKEGVKRDEYLSYTDTESAARGLVAEADGPVVRSIKNIKTQGYSTEAWRRESKKISELFETQTKFEAP